MSGARIIVGVVAPTREGLNVGERPKRARHLRFSAASSSTRQKLT